MRSAAALQADRQTDRQKVSVMLMSLVLSIIAQFRYINIQPQTIDFSTRLWGINYRVCGVYSPEPRGDVYCFKLNFHISKLAYC